MGFFKKNANESAYVGGKKHWADVIKNSGDGDLLIWRQPEEDFNTNSTLIVMPGEEAVFVKGGVIHQVFENGTYKLSTENYPFISRIRNAFTGGISTFNCVVYFVKKTSSRELRWGTDTPIPVRDKVWGIRTEAKVRGAYKVTVDNPAKFIEKLVGPEGDQYPEDLDEYFSAEFQGKIKSAVSRFLNSLEQELIGIDAYMDEISEKIEPFINESLMEYGLKCLKFSLAGLDIDTSKYDTLDEAQIDLITRTKGYQADKAGLDILGNDWNRVQSAYIMRDIANNENGGVAAVGASLGMGFGAAGAFSSMSQQTFAPQQAQPAPAPTPASDDPMEKLAKLKKLFEADLISQQEYDAKKAEILSQL